MNKNQITQYGDELYEALRGCYVVEPLTGREPDIMIEDAYFISQRILERRLQEGETIVGKKIGATSKAVQEMLNVHQPDFGYLTDRMMYKNGSELPVSSKLIQPKAEGEIAFVLKNDLQGPGVTNEDVIGATDYVTPCFEIVDSRIRDWKVKIEDTVADNASCGLFVLGEEKVGLDGLALPDCKMTMQMNGEDIATGYGAAAMGSPLNCVSWLANTLAGFGVALKAGECILSGSLVPLFDIKAGDSMRLHVDGIGTASVDFR